MPKGDLTPAELLALQFEPLPQFRSDVGKENFQRTFDDLAVTSRLVCAILGKTKAELIAAQSEMFTDTSAEISPAEALARRLGEAGETVRALAQLIDLAKVRLMCAVANCYENQEQELARQKAARLKKVALAFGRVESEAPPKR